MQKINLDSNSDQSDQNIENYFKKVNYQGNFSDSQHQNSNIDSSPSEESRKYQTIDDKNNKKNVSKPRQKSKNIKKNCQSAKMSRQRKKVYLQLLEQKAKQIKIQILHRRDSMKDLKQGILQKLRTSNNEKYKFISQKLALSKRMIAMSEKLDKIRYNYKVNEGQINEEIKVEPHNLQLQKNMSPNTLTSIKIEQNKIKSRKKKIFQQKDVQEMEIKQKQLDKKIIYNLQSILICINLEQEGVFVLMQLKELSLNGSKFYK